MLAGDLKVVGNDSGRSVALDGRGGAFGGVVGEVLRLAVDAERLNGGAGVAGDEELVVVLGVGGGELEGEGLGLDLLGRGSGSKGESSDGGELHFGCESCVFLKERKGSGRGEEDVVEECLKLLMMMD